MATFVALIVRLAPNWANLFDGYVPSHTIVSSGALYQSVGIVGATVMPHALFLGSKLATIERTNENEDDIPPDDSSSLELSTTARSETLLRARSPPNGPLLHMPQPVVCPSIPFTPSASPAKPRSFDYIRTHLHHAQLDIAISLIMFALVVNSAILVVASAAFYKIGEEGGDATGVQEGNLFSAYALIRSRVGAAFAYLFALALMMSGQAASITATLAGQVVSEGFIEWRTTPWKRRLVTRAIGIVPALVVSAAVGERGVNTLLVASQVTLSIVLPFVMFP